MDALKFTLSGKTAFFKKPDVNTYFDFSYGMIHKVALLGLLGAVRGYGGHSQQKAKTGKQGGPVYPEFYERLRHLKVAIAPRYHSLAKKIQVFNNSVGYASKEQGGNLIVKEQWLEDPAWDIYIALEDAEGEAIAAALLEQKAIYLPYLGKNDHPANITDVIRLIDLEPCEKSTVIDSLFPSEEFTIQKEDWLHDLEEDSSDEWNLEPKPESGQKSDPDSKSELKRLYQYKEFLPAALSEAANGYELRCYVYTNATVAKAGDKHIWRVNEIGLPTRHIVWM